ncbi:MAG TPA: adenylate/guanylate cyclase domain-containing protein [Tenuifilaceae bacterium]|nr:adenylate/guanylate cyclase domain-containing protein [Tenuifilaceae bacterium]
MAYSIVAICGSERLSREIKSIVGIAEFDFDLHFVIDDTNIITNLTQLNPDIVLFDVSYSEYAAPDLLTIIKNDIKTESVPILAIADFLQPERIQALFIAGADDFISQPLAAAELIQRTMIGIQRGRMLKKLKEQSRQFNSITDAISKAGNSMIVINHLGKITWVNEGFKRLYECPLDYFVSIFGDNLFDSSTNPVTREALDKCRKNGEYVVYESKWVTPQGKEKFIQTSLTPIFDSLQNLSQIIAIETDISDLKAIEKDLEEKHEHLLTITENLESVNAVLAEHQEKIQKQALQLEEEKQKSENLLKNILPWEVAYALQKKGSYKPKKFKEVSVMFTDFVGFSKISSNYGDIDEFLSVLGGFFEVFDEITSQRFIEKIKTIGDSYMCVGGLPRVNRSHPFDTVLAAIEIQRFIHDKAVQAAMEGKPVWNLRIGIHTGSVIAGVIGKRKFAYDIWGDTVNIASRMETASEPGKVNISQTTYSYIKDYFVCTSRGKVPAKNLGEIEMYFVERIKPEYSEDELGLIPNSSFRKIVASF